jgi:hypothetical protein
MWFDNSKTTPLTVKAQVAIRRARQRIGAVNVCYVNSAHVDSELEVEGVPVIGAGCIPPGYLWVGWENERGQALPSRAARVDAEQLSLLSV